MFKSSAARHSIRRHNRSTSMWDKSASTQTGILKVSEDYYLSALRLIDASDNRRHQRRSFLTKRTQYVQCATYVSTLMVCYPRINNYLHQRAHNVASRKLEFSRVIFDYWTNELMAYWLINVLISKTDFNFKEYNDKVSIWNLAVIIYCWKL